MNKFLIVTTCAWLIIAVGLLLGTFASKYQICKQVFPEISPLTCAMADYQRCGK